MAKRFLASLSVVVSLVAFQGCGKSAKTVAEDKAAEGRARQESINTAQQQLLNYGIVLQTRDASQDAAVPSQTRLTARMMRADQLVSVRDLINKYLVDIARLIEIAKSEDIAYGGSIYSLERYQMNAQAALDQINAEIGSRTAF